MKIVCSKARAEGCSLPTAEMKQRRGWLFRPRSRRQAKSELPKDGKRSILGVSVSLSEAEVHRREFLKLLQDRGLHGVKLITSDDLAGLKKAVQSRFGGTLWQRCQFHLQKNASSYVPKRAMQSQVSSDIRQIFRANKRADANEMLRRAVSSYKQKAPKLSAWMEENIPEGLSVLEIPPTHRMRTSNGLERLNKEIKRRTEWQRSSPMKNPFFAWCLLSWWRPVTNGRLGKPTYSWKAFDEPAAFKEKRLLYQESCPALS